MATKTITIVINGPISTIIDFIPVSGLNAPVAAGTKLGDIVVGPSGWSGTISASGSDVSVSGLTLVAARQLSSGSYTTTLVSDP